MDGDMFLSRTQLYPLLGLTEDGTVAEPAAPEPDVDRMLYGLLEDVAAAATGSTESSLVAVAAGFLTFLSSACGRDIYLPVGNIPHHARVFSIHVGRSGRGRKGDALSLTSRLVRRLNELHPGLLGQIHTGGLSSREGLAWLIRDRMEDKDGATEDPGILDKRLWVVESEFANIAQQIRRDGNTLSAAIRDAWDGTALKPATKSSRTWVSDPHIAISAAITPGELLEMIERRELTNGFAGRFLIFWAERKHLIPWPIPPADEVIDALVARIAEVIQFAKGNYPQDTNSRRASITPETRRLYSELYEGELNQSLDSPLLDALLERRAPYVLRLALLFAITDRTLLITPEHLLAARAWVRYWVESVRYVFSTPEEEDKTREIRMLGEDILTYLKRQREADRTALVNDCFKRRVSISKIDTALSALLLDGKVIEEKKARADGQPGRPRTLYRLRDE